VSALNIDTTNNGGKHVFIGTDRLSRGLEPVPRSRNLATAAADETGEDIFDSGKALDVRRERMKGHYSDPAIQATKNYSSASLPHSSKANEKCIHLVYS
jgi:hypothetical protein